MARLPPEATVKRFGRSCHLARLARGAAGEEYAWRPELLSPQCALFARKFPQPTAEPMLEVRGSQRRVHVLVVGESVSHRIMS